MIVAQLKAVQHDPLSGHPLHVDFLAIDLKSEITASIPVQLTGEAPGIKAGGVLEQGHHSLEITCTAGNLPDFFEFEIETEVLVLQLATQTPTTSSAEKLAKFVKAIK